MAQQNLDLGTRGDNQTGDDLNEAFVKVQNNFTDLYTNKANISSLPVIIDDNTFATATSSNIPTSESVKEYVLANSVTGSPGADWNINLTNIPLPVQNLTGTNTGDQDLSGKQNLLVSGTNIKTINSNNILGSGNVDITGITNLSYNSLTRNLSSSNGTGAILPLATNTTAGLISNYTEGSFTPILDSANGGGSYTINSDSYYIRIGKQVSITVDLTNINTTGSPVGNLRVVGLPFVSKSSHEFVFTVRMNNFTTSQDFYSIVGSLNTSNTITFVALTDFVNNLYSTFNAPTFSNGILVLTGTYFID